MVDYTQVTNFMNGLVKRLSNGKTSGLWKTLSLMSKNMVSNLFDKKGGRYGRSKWAPLDPKSFGKKRYGSDGSQHGRFSASSMPLQASGNYRRSHRLLGETPLQMRYGSDFSDGSVRLIQNAGRGGRVSMPDANSPEFKAKLNRVSNAYLTRVVKEAHNEAR